MGQLIIRLYQIRFLCSASQNVLKSVLKSLGFVPFGANVTHFRPKSIIPDLAYGFQIGFKMDTPMSTQNSVEKLPAFSYLDIPFTLENIVTTKIFLSMKLIINRVYNNSQ